MAALSARSAAAHDTTVSGAASAPAPDEVAAGPTFWDFDLVPTNAFRNGHPPRVVPQPYVEVRRAAGMTRLRQLWAQWCKELLQLPQAPRSVLDRWIYGQLVVPAAQCSTGDPLLKRPELAVETEVLTRELEKELPAPTYVSWNARRNARRVAAILSTFARASDHWLQQAQAGGAVVPSAVWRALDDARRAASRSSSHADELMRVLESVAAQVRAVIREVLHRELQSMMSLLVREAQSLCQQLGTLAPVEPTASAKAKTTAGDEGDAASQLQQPGEIPPTAPVATPPSAASLAAVLSQAEARAAEAAVVVEQDDGPAEAAREVRLVFGTIKQRLRPLHFQKLCELFDVHNPSASQALRNMVLFCVAQRYSTLFGPDAFETAAMHAALPEFGFRLLHRRLGVCQENYASPFNCYFRHFNSAFGDTDAWLGSLGSFADFVPVEGSFETGPPYTEEAMDQMAVQLMQHLQQSERPLSFVVFVPDWRKPLLEAQRLMESSRFLRDDIVLPGRRYRYVVGHQHQADQRADERYFVLPMDTHLYVLQNAAGAAKWPCKGVLRELVQEMERLAGELSQVPNNFSGRQLPPPNARPRSRWGPAEDTGAPTAKRAHFGVGASDSAREESVSHE